MVILRITGQGLKSIAMLVALLWGCIIGEHVIVKKANMEVYRALRDIRSLQMQKRAEPVLAPRPRIPHPVRPTLG